MVVYRMMMVILLISLKKWCCRGLDFFRMLPSSLFCITYWCHKDLYLMIILWDEYHGDGGDSNDDYKNDDDGHNQMVMMAMVVMMMMRQKMTRLLGKLHRRQSCISCRETETTNFDHLHLPRIMMISITGRYSSWWSSFWPSARIGMINDHHHPKSPELCRSSGMCWRWCWRWRRWPQSWSKLF